MTRLLRLREAERRRAVPLSPAEARWIHDTRIAAVSPGAALGTFDLQVGHRVGTIGYGDLRIAIAPKLPASRVMWMLMVGGLDLDWRDEAVSLDTSDIVEALALLFLRELEAVLRRGLVSGYHQVEQTDVILRGRLRIGEQFGRRYGMLYPLEIEYQEHDRDIPENQILLSALLVLVETLQASGSRLVPRLAGVVPTFASVTPIVAGNVLPNVLVTRLNEHYVDALALADLVLRRSGLSEAEGEQPGKGILFPMWSVFERFVARVLARELTTENVSAQYSTPLVRNSSETFLIRPDIVISEGGLRHLVVDTKFKSAAPTSGDLYQMCAYAGVLGVKDVMLLYAEPAESRTLTMSGTGVRVHIRGVDLSGDRDIVVQSVVNSVGSVRSDFKSVNEPGVRRPVRRSTRRP